MNTSAPISVNEAVASFKENPGLLLLQSGVQHYDWGNVKFIPQLLGIKNPKNIPHAELWMGTHADLPSRACVPGGEISLKDLIDHVPDLILNPDTARQFRGQLPYLFKVLSAAKPLSIQAHPSKQQAEEGFVRENNAGIPVDAKNRNYKDNNHKPELIAALTDFYGLNGFRPLPDIAQVLKTVPEFSDFKTGFKPTPASLKKLYEKLMNLPQDKADAVLCPLIERLTKLNKKKRFGKDQREFWVLRADKEFSKDGHKDRGLFSLYLLNLVHLKPGQAMYLPAGILHAYLEGTGMEIMANSNNVLRGGLTPKHVDVQELLNSLVFDGGTPDIIEGAQTKNATECVYATPAKEFELRRIDISKNKIHHNECAHSAEILIVTGLSRKAKLSVSFNHQTLKLSLGQMIMVPQGTAYSLNTTGKSTIYKAVVPQSQLSSPSGQKPMLSFRGRQPMPLAFGTSGLRGLVTDITDLEAYINTLGFMDYLAEIGDVVKGDTVCMAGDLRPSTDSPKRSIMRAVARAIHDAGLKLDYLGKIPTPALCFYAMQKGHPSVMVTGSHIPFDRNGIKFNKSTGEILKSDEPGILEAVNNVRLAEYTRPSRDSLFEDNGMLKKPAVMPLPPGNDRARDYYIQRYLNFFPAQGLKGKRIVFYQHSAVGRDLIVDLLKKLGADVVPMGKSNQFIPIDTEDISEAKLKELQSLVNKAQKARKKVDALVSTDGDSDRPLVVGVDAKGKVKFFGGDLLGTVTADYLNADAISVPISSNDAVDLHFAKREAVVTKTRIGSPHVIQSMQNAEYSDKSNAIVGWEANGGFLTGSTIERRGKFLKALPTRDAVLPILSALYACTEKNSSLVDLFSQLPPRFSKAGLLDNFPKEISRSMISTFSPKDPHVTQSDFYKNHVALFYDDGRCENAPDIVAAERMTVQKELKKYFPSEKGFDEITRINTIDGIRIYFKNNDVAHIRPSGNAPQLRIYAVADTQKRADDIVKMGLKERHGILRTIESKIKGHHG